jgi:hypothetical protein
MFRGERAARDPANVDSAISSVFLQALLVRRVTQHADNGAREAINLDLEVARSAHIVGNVVCAITASDNGNRTSLRLCEKY